MLRSNLGQTWSTSVKLGQSWSNLPKLWEMCSEALFRGSFDVVGPCRVRSAWSNLGQTWSTLVKLWEIRPRPRLEVILMWWALVGSSWIGSSCFILRADTRENPGGKNGVMTHGVTVLSFSHQSWSQFPSILSPSLPLQLSRHLSLYPSRLTLTSPPFANVKVGLESRIYHTLSLVSSSLNLDSLSLFLLVFYQTVDTSFYHLHFNYNVHRALRTKNPKNGPWHGNLCTFRVFGPSLF